MSEREELIERLQAIIDWADLALMNPQLLNSHGVRNLDGPVFDAAREVLERALSRPNLNDGWRPIESAPKDGTRVLVWSPNFETAFACDWDGGSWQTGVWSARNPPQVTHWMPLPAPPSLDTQNEGEG